MDIRSETAKYCKNLKYENLKYGKPLEEQLKLLQQIVANDNAPEDTITNYRNREIINQH